MLFNSLQYLVFLPFVVGVYFALPHRLRTLFLLVASYYFYMCWKPEYIVLILISTLSTFGAGLWIANAKTPAAKRAILAACLAVNLAILALFKYANFFGESVNALFASLNIFIQIPATHWLLPVGISFYTFQSLSYAIDVYRGDKAPERSVLTFMLYVSFFPQLVAGPIERSTRLLPQLTRHVRFDLGLATTGLQLILWGFFKKIVIADRVALIVDPVFSEPARYGATALLAASYAFTYQIYCDFSGYSDIAIGSALLLGIRLMDNFNRPYFAVSIQDFWRRWHISLTTWFRDYLYIPLGGNRVTNRRWIVNILLVFLISGLWHGAAWTFVIWGGLHGVMLVASRQTMGLRQRMTALSGLARIPRVHTGLRMLITFHLVVLAWIFFRADSLHDAGLVFSGLFAGLSGQTDGTTLLGLSSLPLTEIIAAIVAITALELLQALAGERGIPALWQRLPIAARWAIYCLLVWAILIFGKYGDNAQEFVYFQF